MKILQILSKSKRQKDICWNEHCKIEKAIYNKSREISDVLIEINIKKIEEINIDMKKKMLNKFILFEFELFHKDFKFAERRRKFHF
jgi:hypothetical protein